MPPIGKIYIMAQALRKKFCYWDSEETHFSKYAGKSLAEVAKIRNTTPEDAAIDLIIQDSSRVEVAYFMMSEENVKKQSRCHG
jgi:N-acyl-D-aspartate/D-glutamate deacylase